MPEERKIYDDLRIVFDKEVISNFSHNLDLNVIEYKCWEILISYFQNLETTIEQEWFSEELFKHVFNTKLIFLCFYVSYNIWIIDKLLNYISSEILFTGHSTYILIEFLEKNIDNFTTAQLSNLLDIVNHFSPHDHVWNYYEWIARKDDLKKHIIELRFDEFEKHIKGINIEINRDKQTVQEYLRDFWFNEKYNITLNKLDAYIQSEQWEWEVVPWWVIGILREFFNWFYIDLASEIAQLNWLDYVPKNKISTTNIWHARNYITKEFKLSSAEDGFIHHYKDICNNSWSHALLSEKKYLRLTRNIWIEILLFMLEKFNDQKMNKEIE